jgi:hypothetical protein
MPREKRGIQHSVPARWKNQPEPTNVTPANAIVTRSANPWAGLPAVARSTKAENAWPFPDSRNLLLTLP